MIHNIEEERKKQNSRKNSLSESFDDEELMRLIGQVEERALIHAPRGMKESILFQLDEERQRRRRRQLFSYRAKVLVGMAAALAVLFLMPEDGSGAAKMQETGIWGFWQEEETAALDEWDQDVLERQQDIDRVWERYQRGRERADARKQYVEDIKKEWMNNENRED